jgi:hypothetical protein
MNPPSSLRNFCSSANIWIKNKLEGSSRSPQFGGTFRESGGVNFSASHMPPYKKVLAGSNGADAAINQNRFGQLRARSVANLISRAVWHQSAMMRDPFRPAPTS